MFHDDIEWHRDKGQRYCRSQCRDRQTTYAPHPDGKGLHFVYVGHNGIEVGGGGEIRRLEGTVLLARNRKPLLLELPAHDGSQGSILEDAAAPSAQEKAPKNA